MEKEILIEHFCCGSKLFLSICDKPFDPSSEKSNNVVSELVRHKSGCTVTEDG